ncbi:MAG: hypothetical protein DHS20C21_10530 [Gemmatimonadota bacterium]|nr:MAG: hypothetical protein DHS20C21_10530 [Gemmatimonadota bacterium]
MLIFASADWTRRVLRPGVAWLRALPVLFLLPMSASAAVLLNEFEHTATGTDRIEVYNTRSDTTIDLSTWYLENDLGATFALSGLLGPNGHASFVTIGSIVTDGGLIELYDGALPFPRDSVPFGDAGGAPLPPPVGSYSCGRSPDGVNSGDPAADWNLDTSATFAAANDHPPAKLGMTTVYLNEGGRGGVRASGSCTAPFVELYNRHPSMGVNLNGWRLVDGRSVTLLSGGIPSGGFVVITDFGPNFCFEVSRVLYLFNDVGQRVDQFGIAGQPLPGGNAQSYQRLPDGAFPGGPYDGFDFATSGGGTSFFVLPKTPGNTNQLDVAAPETVESLSWGEAKGRYR